mgnify:CR=1 FL=1
MRRDEFDHQRDSDEDLTTTGKVNKLWEERTMRNYIRSRRMDLLKIWGACLSLAATAAGLLSMIVNWKR